MGNESGIEQEQVGENQIDRSEPRAFLGVVGRWIVAVVLTCGLLLLLGVSWTAVGLVFGFEVLLLGFLYWDTRQVGGPVSTWYHVEWDAHRIVFDVKADKGWHASIPWEAVREVCLKMTGPLTSSTAYVWVDGREHSFPVAFDADNGWEFVQELPKRGLFPNTKLVEAMAMDGETMCHKVRDDTGVLHPDVEVSEG